MILYLIAGLACFGLMTVASPADYIIQFFLAMFLWPVLLPITLWELHFKILHLQHQRALELTMLQGNKMLLKANSEKADVQEKNTEV